MFSRAMLIAVLVSVGPAAAQTLPELPLDRGFYVRTDGSCGNANNADTALLTRSGLQWITSQCAFESIEQTGPTTWRVVQSCGDAQYREQATAEYEIADRTSFSFKDSNGWEHAARFCAQRDLPEPWRTNDISDLID